MLESWIRLQEQFRPKVYYAECEYVVKGQIIKVSESDYFPEYIIVHPDDVLILKEELNLTPLKEAPRKPYV